MPGELSCGDVAGDLLSDYHDGALPTEKKDAVEEHIQICRPCMNAVRGYCAAARLAKAAMWTEPPDHSEKSLIEYLRRHGAI